MTTERIRKVCASCLSTEIKKMKFKKGYNCHKCGIYFENPVMRTVKGHQHEIVFREKQKPKTV